MKEKLVNRENLFYDGKYVYNFLQLDSSWIITSNYRF